MLLKTRLYYKAAILALRSSYNWQELYENVTAKSPNMFSFNHHTKNILKKTKMEELGRQSRKSGYTKDEPLLTVFC